MKRTFNYTQRRVIKRQDISIRLHEEAGVWIFDADLRQLTSYKFPHNAEVWVEAHRQNLWMQFGWGTISLLRPPMDRRLTEFDGAEGILFRVRVVMPQGAEHNKLVAEADGLRYVKTGDADDLRRPLITPEPDTLDQLLWKLDLESDPPKLLVNRDARPTWKAMTRSPYFIALVYPEVMRQMLTKALLDPKNEYTDDDEDEGWKTDWVKFARNLGGMEPLPHVEDRDARETWIDSAVAAFSRHHKIRETLELAINEEDKK